ncbi:glycoside hydrolase family 31 protein [Terriglobus aquaticus]|uniref:TIM-barrel domain-containing protein n=1 Tax=Terriglobus aquaticus TaxID=940139 RepID=A0ABW9KJB8_9BACT|nr:glycoside hydrolase family 31 protein [Terriglobus aquaticus]
MAQAAPDSGINPVANSAAVVSAGDVRFTVLTPQLIRLESSADGHFVDDASFIFLNRNLPVPAFQKKITAREVTIDTADLHLVYRPGDGEGFTAQNLGITLKLDGHPVTWHPGMATTGNLLGTTRTLDGAQGAEHLREPIGQGLVSREGWAVVDDNGPLFDSVAFSTTHDATTQPWVKPRPATERSDLYFFGYGHDYKAALGDYVRVAGRIPLPPRFAFGAWWSRYWAYTDQELRDLVNGFHENNLPLDVFVIDMDWHKTFGRHFDEQDASGHSKGWSGYSWDNTLFPDPKDFLTELHDQGLKVTLNLHPASGVQPWETAYPEFARKMGMDPASGKYVPFDLTNRTYALNYMDLLHHPLEREGVDFWWLDWQQEGKTQVAGVNPTWWLNYIHFTDQEHEGKRPLLFHRWGGLGNHRYQIGFSGDTVSVWDSLAFQPWFTATAANVGYAYWSHDIGGHMPGKVDPELYARWIQFGIFSPILRTHTTKNPEAERRVWAYPEPFSDVMRSAFQLRYAMQPYLYTEGRRTYDTGVAFDRPLYYDYPEAAEAYTSKNEYMFGDNMLVAPVTTPANTQTGLSTEHIWLPKGEWIEWSTGAHLHGPVAVDRSYAIEQLPVFVKPGTILPMQPPMLYTGQKPVDPLILTVFPLADGQTVSYSVYEDSGHAEDYQKNVGTAWTDVKVQQHGEELTVKVAPVRGSYDGMPRQRRLELRLPGDFPPESVTVNGTPLTFTLKSNGPGWRFDGNTLTTTVPTEAIDVQNGATITVRRAAGSLGRRKQLDGFAGRVERLRMAYDQLSADYPTTAAVPDTVTAAMQTGDRIGYHPETAAAELRDFAKHYAEALAATDRMIADSKPATKSVSGAPAAPADADRDRQHQQRIEHAHADLTAAP